MYLWSTTFKHPSPLLDEHSDVRTRFAQTRFFPFRTLAKTVRSTKMAWISTDFSVLSIMKIRYAGSRVVSCAPDENIFIGTSQCCTWRRSTFFTKHLTWSTTATPTHEFWDERYVTWGNRLYWPNYSLVVGLGVKRKGGTRRSSPLCIHLQVLSIPFKNVYSYRRYECTLDGENFFESDLAVPR
jgi:hypothetical protein